MNMLKRNKGITMIAMVITIVVLLTIALVTVRILITEGILDKSEKTTSMYNKEEATEKMNLKITNLQILSYTQTQTLPDLQYLADGLCEDEEIEYVLLEKQAVADVKKINVGESKSIFTKLKEYQYEFEIDSSLRLASIDGVKIADNTDNLEEIEKLKTIIGQMGSNIEELNTKIGTLMENNKSLQTEISNLRQKDIDLQTAINNVNTEKTTYTYTELASTNSTTDVQKTLKNNLSNYKYVILIIQVDSNKNRLVSGMITTEMFRNLGAIGCATSGSNGHAYYINDTTCKMHSNHTEARAVLYGVN